MLKEINTHAGAVDVGSETFHAAVYAGPMKVFGTFTRDLQAVLEFFKENGVNTVVMEATGVYWMPLYDTLQKGGLKVCMVNGAHVKNVPGRKTDVADSQWLAELHAHGLLEAGFVPEAPILRLRDYQRLRQDHIEMGSQHVLHMQKALERMNVKVHDVLSQLIGFSGLQIVNAILKGERDPEKLADLCDNQVLIKKRDRLIESLRGHWQPEHLFALGQALEGWEFYQGQIAQCDQQIAQALAEVAAPLPEVPTEKLKPLGQRKPGRHNSPHITGLYETLVRLCGGNDPTQLPTVTEYMVLQLISETGTDMSRWPTPKHFTSWLGLAPGSRQSGKHRGSQKRFRGRAGRIFCVAARSLARSKHLALGGFYRRIRATCGGQVANIASARKIAQLYYNTLRYGSGYVEQGLKAYEEKYRRDSIRRLHAVARRFGLKLIDAPADSP
jgi:transposase